MNSLFSLHLFSTFFMTGLIWLVQCIVYPQYGFYSEADFKNIHQNHVKKISFIIGPVMGLELITAVGLYVVSNNNIWLLNLIGIFLIWMCTFFLNIPSHDHLVYSNKATQKKLVLYNWPRTFIWSLRSIFFIYYVQFLIPGDTL